MAYGGNNKSVVRQMLMGEIHQFPILYVVGEFLAEGNGKDFPMRVRAVCRTTDQLVKKDEVLWRRILGARLASRGETLRREARRAKTAYNSWLVHVTLTKWAKEKKSYWPSMKDRVRWFKVHSDLQIAHLRLRRETEAPDVIGQVVPGWVIDRFEWDVSRKLEKIEAISPWLAFRKEDEEDVTMEEMVESGRVIKTMILPRVQAMIEVTRKPRKPKTVVVPPSNVDIINLS